MRPLAEGIFEDDKQGLWFANLAQYVQGEKDTRELQQLKPEYQLPKHVLQEMDLPHSIPVKLYTLNPRPPRSRTFQDPLKLCTAQPRAVAGRVVQRISSGARLTKA